MVRRLLLGSWVLAACAVGEETQPQARDGPASDVAAAEALASLAPGRTRGGQPRFAQPEVEQPAAAPVLLQRLRSGGEPSDVRAALAEALPRTGGEWARPAVELLGTERDPAVRKAIVATLRRAPPELALAGLRAGLADPDGLVRYEAAMTAGFVPAAAELEVELRAILSDPEPRARAAAARSLGVLGRDGSAAAIAACAADPDRHVRLEVVSALGRLGDQAAARAVAARLSTDEDPKVARAAARLARQLR